MVWAAPCNVAAVPAHVASISSTCAQYATLVTTAMPLPPERLETLNAGVPAALEVTARAQMSAREVCAYMFPRIELVESNMQTTRPECDM